MKNQKNILTQEGKNRKSDSPEVPLFLVNSHCRLSINACFKELLGRDLKDQYNLPTFYNLTERGLKKAWLVMVKQFHDNMTMWEAKNVFTDNGVRCRSYCAMD